MSCEKCTDETGYACFPVYGLAPHTHDQEDGLLSTQINDMAEWPENFTPDADESGMGIWSCPYCGRGKPK